MALHACYAMKTFVGITYSQEMLVKLENFWVDATSNDSRRVDLCSLVCVARAALTTVFFVLVELSQNRHALSAATQIC